MRHSRKRVMKEHYKLYMKKHIFNGRYFQRNLQIVMCMVLVVALTAGCIVIGKSADTGSASDQAVDVREALFGNNESSTKDVKDDRVEDKTKDTYTDTEVASTQATTTEAIAVMVMADVTEDTTEEAVVEEEPSLFDDRCIANVEDTLNIRMEPDTESEFVGSMESGAIAIVEGTEGEWTKIKSGDVEGYVLTQYILTGSVAEAFAKDYVILHGTILEDGVNIRSEKSTDADIVTILDKDAVVTVLENTEDAEESVQVQEAEAVISEKDALPENTEQSDDADLSEESIDWLQVRLEDGQEGYVSADYISIDELYQVAVSKEELERQAAEEAARIAAEEEAKREAERQQAAATTKKSSSGSSSSSGGGSYSGASTTPIMATQAGDSLGTFTVTAYCGCSKCSSGNNLTATGTVPTQGRTIAADPSVLPYGTKVVIGGAVYTVEDCGSGVRGNHIDIFFATHDQALAFGRRTMQVFKY